MFGSRLPKAGHRAQLALTGAGLWLSQCLLLLVINQRDADTVSGEGLRKEAESNWKAAGNCL